MLLHTRLFGVRSASPLLLYEGGGGEGGEGSVASFLSPLPPPPSRFRVAVRLRFRTEIVRT